MHPTFAECQNNHREEQKNYKNLDNERTRGHHLNLSRLGIEPTTFGALGRVTTQCAIGRVEHITY